MPRPIQIMKVDTIYGHRCYVALDDYLSSKQEMPLYTRSGRLYAATAAGRRAAALHQPTSLHKHALAIGKPDPLDPEQIRREALTALEIGADALSKLGDRAGERDAALMAQLRRLVEQIEGFSSEIRAVLPLRRGRIEYAQGKLADLERDADALIARAMGFGPDHKPGRSFDLDAIMPDVPARPGRK